MSTPIALAATLNNKVGEICKIRLAFREVDLQSKPPHFSSAWHTQYDQKGHPLLSLAGLTILIDIEHGHVTMTMPYYDNQQVMEHLYDEHLALMSKTLKRVTKHINKGWTPGMQATEPHEQYAQYFSNFAKSAQCCAGVINLNYEVAHKTCSTSQRIYQTPSEMIACLLYTSPSPRDRG